jgi:hypothetical protein
MAAPRKNNSVGEQSFVTRPTSIRHWSAAIAAVFLSSFAASVRAGDPLQTAPPAQLPPERRSEPLIVSGSSVRSLEGIPAAQVFVFRYDRSSGWQQVAHQIDERRMTKLWSEAKCPAQCEERYVFDSAEGNGLDADDEIVFLASDLGEKAGTDRPEGAAKGYEVEVRLPSGEPAGYVYVYSSKTLSQQAARSLVSYSRTRIDPSSEDTSITTDKYRVHFSRLWVLDELAVLSGAGGDGTDLLDQWKGRAYDRSLRGETEDVVGMCAGWSNAAPDWGSHKYLGHVAGPIRAIRSIQGACSWPNLTRTDVFYRDMAEIIINVRGHRFAPGSGGLWMYWDYAQAALPLTYSNPLVPAGTTIDGTNDAAYENGDHMPELKDGAWEQVSGVHGGFAFTIRQTMKIPGSVKPFFGDDSAFDDGTGSERGVLGGHGIHVVHVENTDPATGGRPAQAIIRYRPLAAGAESVGAKYLAIDQAPLVVKTYER